MNGKQETVTENLQNDNHHEFCYSLIIRPTFVKSQFLLIIGIRNYGRVVTLMMIQDKLVNLIIYGRYNPILLFN